MSALTPLAVAPLPTGELAISWNDGVEQYLHLELLRKACPCAVCCGEPDVTGKVILPSKQYKANSFELKSYDFVGGYAILFRWGDGHASGIYSYKLMRSLS